VTAAQSRAYLGKAQEYLDAATSELAAGRSIAATSLAVHAGINAADAVAGVRLGRRSAAQDHKQLLALLRESGKDGTEAENALSRLLPLKTKTEYEPTEISKSEAARAVQRAARCVTIAQRAISSQ
jgi:hypothetical protein